MNFNTILKGKAVKVATPNPTGGDPIVDPGTVEPQIASPVIPKKKKKVPTTLDPQIPDNTPVVAGIAVGNPSI